jgi:sec-independent protein translocase protein TatA
VKPGLFQILIIALIILVLFGRGRISEMMGDFGKGIKSFKKGLGDDEDGPARIEGREAQPVVEAATDKTAG